MAEPIVIDDGDGEDEVQCLGVRASPQAAAHRSTSTHSSSSSSSSSSKKRKTKQVTDARLLNHTDWEFRDGIRDAPPEERSRANTMSLGDAPSPRSTGSVAAFSPRSPTPAINMATPARSYILIDSEDLDECTLVTMTICDNNNTLPSSKISGAAASQQQQIRSSHSPLAGLSAGQEPNGNMHLEPRNASHISNTHHASMATQGSGSSRTSSGLSEPPESRGVSFATFQRGLTGSEERLPPRIQRLTLDETPRVIIDLDDGDEAIEVSDGDDGVDEDDEVVITAVSSRQVSPEDIVPSIFLRRHDVRRSEDEMSLMGTGMAKKKSPTPPKRKREEAFGEEGSERSVDERVASRTGSLRSDGGFARPGPPNRPSRERVVVDLDDDDVSVYHPCSSSSSSGGSSLRSGRSVANANSGRGGRSLTPARRTPSLQTQQQETIEIPDDDRFVEDGDDADLSGDDLDENENPPLAFGSFGRPINLGDEANGEEYGSDEIEVTGERKLTLARRPTVALNRRKSSAIPYRNPAIEYPLEELPELPHQNWLFTKGTFMEVKDTDGTGTIFLLINHIIMNQHTGEIKLRGHKFMRTRNVSAMLEYIRNEMCRVLEVDEDDARPWMEQAQIEVGLDACIYAPRQINITNRPIGERGSREYGVCTFRPLRRRTEDSVVEERLMLACRWECVVFWPTARHRMKGVCKGVPPRILRMLKEDDGQLVGRDVRRSDEGIRDKFRGEGVTVMGGAYIPGREVHAQGFFRLNNGEVQKVRVNFDDHHIFGNVVNTFNIDLTGDIETSFSGNGSEPVRSHSHFSAHLTRTIDLTDPTPLPPSGTIRASMSNASTPLRGSQPFKRRPGQMYTYGDAFCGAGGATRGAHMAGLKVLWGFDKDTHACSSWHRNFPGAAIYEMDAQTICSLASPYDTNSSSGSPSTTPLNLSCDILHMSPPCQYFSPAHTIAGKDDDMNSAALFSIDTILATVRPRIATLEQTFGITNPVFKHYFEKLINMFTSVGYSVTYKVCQLHHWGLAQRRCRLIIIGAAPGERIPTIPAYTHFDRSKPVSSSPGLLPYQSVSSLISRIPPTASDHLPYTFLKTPQRPWDGSSICPRAMTCAGGQNYHFDGKRMFTNREFAAIQGFPEEHRFSRVNVKKQIGNAVPPVVAEVLLRAVRACLEERDGVEREVVVLDE